MRDGMGRDGRLPGLCHVFANSEPVDLRVRDNCKFDRVSRAYSALGALVVAAGKSSTGECG
jgi:hypothetical protein